VRVKGVENAPNAVLHPWLKQELQAILEQLALDPPVVAMPLSQDHPLRLTWLKWWHSYHGDKPAPTLRLILVWDNLAGHLTYDLVRWLLKLGILPLYTPIGGSWLNMAESIQRILVRRALAGEHPKSPQEIITWLVQTAAGWNRHPTPFVWAGKRKARRERARLRRLSGSGAAIPNGYSIAA
jgi:hypothetical protein